ncbi:flavin reductase family protein [Paraburkholderia bannensis]|uniref:flavin reductase family protein n=1 Tax=Paraburkholderia bannensis TaxID=765414 RepID=UPI002AB0F04D|nr:flavin reductase family protein [Paraburkholderia bannensis]
MSTPLQRAPARDYPVIEQKDFRKVLGHYPTGVCIVTTRVDGNPLGLTIGSFTSVSLDPPLVGFLPARSSKTWPLIQRAGTFCVNVLADDQEALSRRFATSVPERFSDVTHSTSGLGLPVLDGALAWIDCELYSVQDAGDHLFVLGRVMAMEAVRNSRPLLFFQGGFGRFVSCEAA